MGELSIRTSRYLKRETHNWPEAVGKANSWLFFFQTFSVKDSESFSENGVKLVLLPRNAWLYFTYLEVPHDLHLLQRCPSKFDFTYCPSLFPAISRNASLYLTYLEGPLLASVTVLFLYLTFPCYIMEWFALFHVPGSVPTCICRSAVPPHSVYSRTFHSPRCSSPYTTLGDIFQ